MLAMNIACPGRCFSAEILPYKKNIARRLEKLEQQGCSCLESGAECYKLYTCIKKNEAYAGHNISTDTMKRP